MNEKSYDYLLIIYLKTFLDAVRARKNKNSQAVLVLFVHVIATNNTKTIICQKVQFKIVKFQKFRNSEFVFVIALNYIFLHWNQCNYIWTALLSANQHPEICVCIWLNEVNTQFYLNNLDLSPSCRSFRYFINVLITKYSNLNRCMHVV